jgi:hypothetical protein
MGGLAAADAAMDSLEPCVFFEGSAGICAEVS